jgi:hypothetical protein
MPNACMVGLISGASIAEQVKQPVDDIEDRLREICGQLQVLHAQVVALAHRGRRHRGMGVAGLGVRSLAHWLCWQGGLSAPRAAETVRLAVARTMHPEVMDALSEGNIGGSEGDRHQGAG